MKIRNGLEMLALTFNFFAGVCLHHHPPLERNSTALQHFATLGPILKFQLSRKCEKSQIARRGHKVVLLSE